MTTVPAAVSDQPLTVIVPEPAWALSHSDSRFPEALAVAFDPDGYGPARLRLIVQPQEAAAATDGLPIIVIPPAGPVSVSDAVAAALAADAVWLPDRGTCEAWQAQGMPPERLVVLPEGDAAFLGLWMRQEGTRIAGRMGQDRPLLARRRLQAQLRQADADGDPRRVLALADLAGALVTDHADLATLVGHARLKAQQVAAAVPLFLRAVTLQPTAAAMTNLVTALLMAGAKVQARPWLDYLLRWQPEFAPAQALDSMWGAVPDAGATVTVPPPPDRTPRLSVAMIVRNEAAALPEALASVRGVADEIVVVDTGSDDGSQAIAAAAGATVVNWPWRDDFAAARNVAIEHCTGDWILCLDADERLQEAAPEAVRGVIAMPWAPEVVLRLLLSSRMLGQDRQQDIMADRLFQRHADLRYAGTIHEQPQWLGPKGHLTAVALQDVALHHDGYQDAGTMTRKLARNADLLRRQLDQEPDNARALAYWGEHCWRSGRTIEAAVALAKAAVRASAEGQSIGIIATSLLWLVTVLSAQQSFAGAHQLAELAVLVCDEPGVWFALAQAQLANGDAEAAAATLRRCLDDDAPADTVPVDAALRTKWVPLVLADALVQLNRPNQALQTLEAALLAHPDDTQLFQAFMQRQIARGKGKATAVDLLRVMASATEGQHWPLLRRTLTAMVASVDPEVQPVVVRQALAAADDDPDRWSAAIAAVKQLWLGA